MLLKLWVGASNEIPESSVNSSNDKEIKLRNAAKMSRKEIFSPNYTLFKGDISALPRSPSSYLWWPKSTNITWNKNTSLNLAQLIRFNAVKKRHYYHSYHLPFKWTTTPTFNILLRPCKNKEKADSRVPQYNWILYVIPQSTRNTIYIN